ncbi:phage tail assembly protein [Pelotomaculum propionicicum]|uniref:Phage tail assembly protein n=1 Tax=Pelotomaculum propionicicum TaxID=258475 RepID=A0A4Y7RXF9_9FIRM|nr:phage tail assembly protein [Pelotomaculum propionicicum]TEB13362.1 hypothetical protein Pmgp_00256 [Pelotomaculum propionicicum]
MKTITLSRPFTFEDKEYTEINLDLDSLTGRDLIDSEREAVVVVGPSSSPVVELSKPYSAALAAKAAKVPIEMILELPARDFTMITMTVQDFLLS